MAAISSDQIVSILREEITNYDFNQNDEEVGKVVRVGDGIATIYGMNHAMYGEIVVFDSGVKGMVQDIKENQIGCILFGQDSEIHEGSTAVRTHKRAGVPVGEGFIGRFVIALGEPIDGKGEIQSDDYRPVEEPAPSIVDRQSVDTPLATGILSIDSMFPIGRGQRELIIGDRQTGKPSIAIDTILNQKGKDVICVYNAIGQKASTVAKLVHTLDKYGALDYTIVVCSTASDPSSLQYISPYSATAMAEYFMYKGKDCLIVYDDLSKHAVAYRALSLLLERSPGREAYPGDVFYLHSRLLERSSRLSDKLGGGSLTALPIIETQAGDLSAYIPTNVISITDGQIFLESDLFFSGQRPAVNVGLSVSRVGGAAQTKAMKKAAGSLRIDLAQFREMEVFTQFSSDLDDETKASLTYGKGLMELLKQPLCHPMSLADQVITLVAANNDEGDEVRFALYDAGEELTASGFIQFVPDYDYDYFYNEHDGVAYRSWFDEVGALHVAELGTFTQMTGDAPGENTGDIDFEMMAGTWYLDAEADAPSILVLDENGGCELLERPGGDGDPTVVDCGTIEVNQDGAGQYFAASTVYEDVVYDLTLVGDDVIYWGGEYDYYQKMA